MRAQVTRIPLLAIGFALVASLLLGAVANITVNAQEEASGSGLSISPTRTELRIEKGSSDTLELSVRNITRGAIIAKPFVSDFDSDDSTGEPRLRADSAERSSASIAPFVKGLEDISLAAGETKNLTYTIEIPSDAPSGAYYGAVTYRAVPANQASLESGQVALTANVAPLVLIEVPGDITEQIQLTSINVQKGDKKSSFFTTKPDSVAIAVKNNGNGFSKPFGKVVVNDMSGKEVFSYELNDSTPRSNILPKTSRTFTDGIQNVNKPGRYTVVASISHGNGGEVLVQKVSFWYIPVWLLITLLVLVLGIAGGAYYLYRRQTGTKRKK